MAFDSVRQVHGIAYPHGKDSLPSFLLSYGMHGLPYVRILGKDG
jgi:hypothetical protein